ncbi:MAG: hypothetical protein RL653_536 [Pseudomonadota bacterium]
MPEICRFYGLLVRMYFDDHPPPHVHVHYGEFELVMQIDTLEPIRGELPPRALSLLREWVLANRDLLMQNWVRLEAGLPLIPVKPLE